jgi:hypothetical protein
METHIRVLGYLYIVLGALGILAGLFVLLVMGGTASLVGGAAGGSDGQLAGPVIAIIGAVMAAVVVMVSLPGLIAGYGLLQRRSWARVLAIVVSSVNLLNIPLGTAIGIYGLWVLLSADAQRIFKPQARAAGA